MSLPLLVLIVAVGIAAVVIAVHMTGGSRVARLDGEDAARRRFAEDFPDLEVRTVRLTEDRGAAFLDLADGRVAIVNALGGKFLTRIVSAGDLAGAPRASGRSLAIRLRDFTWSGGIFAFERAEDASALEASFTAMRRSGFWEKT